MSTYDTSETHPETYDTNLISAERVNGTAVYNRQDEKLGTVDSVLIDKVSGNVPYVVMSFGGFLGIGEKYHPLPWNQLQYDSGIGGYRIDLDRGQLEGAPSYDRETVDSFDYGRDSTTIDSYYASTGAGFAVPTPDASRRAADGPDGDRRTVDRRASDRDKIGSDGFYSPQQQAERNRPADSETAHRDLARGERGDADLIDGNPISGVPGSTSGDWATRNRD